MKTFNDPKGFELKQIETLNIIKEEGHIGTYVFNNNCTSKYPRSCTMVSVHDGNNLTVSEFKEKIPELNAKYARRLNRFYDRMNSGQKVILIRAIKPVDGGALENSPETLEQITTLYNLLKLRFPSADFELFIVDKEQQLVRHEETDAFAVFHSFDDLKASIIDNKANERTL